jgi:hypothetical protein
MTDSDVRKKKVDKRVPSAVIRKVESFNRATR